jgi:Zn-finger protein
MIIDKNYIDGEGKLLFYNSSLLFKNNCTIKYCTFLRNQKLKITDYDFIFSLSDDDVKDFSIKNCIFIENEKNHDILTDKIIYYKKMTHVVNGIKRNIRKNKLKKLSEI